MNLSSIKKIKRSIRAISPVISVLLMIAIAVVASLVAYAWVMGYMNFQTSKTGQSIQIPSYAEGITDDNMQMRLYVQNVGQGLVTVGNVYVNDAQVQILLPANLDLNAGETKELTVQLNAPWHAGEQVTVKVTTTSGTFMETKGTGSSSSSNPSGNGDVYILTINTNGGTGTGTVTPVSGTTYYTVTSVQLSATASEGSEFAGWAGDLTITENPTTIVMNENKTITAVFNLIEPDTFTVTFDQTGLDDASDSSQVLTVNGDAITKSQLPYPKTVNVGDTITYSYATPISGGAGKQYITNPASGSLTSGTTITADYTTQYQLTFAVTGSGTINPSGTNVWVDAGPLAISATENPGNHFNTWSATNGITITGLTTNPNTATIGSSGTITADFDANAPQTLFSDDFNSYADLAAPSSSKWSTITDVVAYHSSSGLSSNNPYASFGTSAELRSVSISCASYNTVTLSYYRQTDNNGPTLSVEWRIGSGSWTTLETVNPNSAWTQKTYTLNGADGQSIQIRFTTNNDARARIDNVVVTGISN